MANWLIDIDSTTMDTTGTQIRLLNERFGMAYTLDHITAWQWEDYMPAEHCSFVWGEEVFNNPEFHRVCPPIDRAFESLKVLRDTGETLFFVSDRPDFLYDVTRAWLDTHGFENEDLIFTHRQTYPKMEAAKKYGLTHVVEDAPHHSFDLAQQPFIKRVFLLDKPYNRQVSHDKVTRVSGWDDIVRDHVYLNGRKEGA